MNILRTMCIPLCFIFRKLFVINERIGDVLFAIHGKLSNFAYKNKLPF